MPGTHPNPPKNRRLLNRVALHHLSWTRVLNAAVTERVHRGKIDDREQAFILDELIRYLRHPAAGVVGFSDMGGDWVAIRNAVRNGTFHPRDAGASETADKWDQLIAYACMQLTVDLGADVTPYIPRAAREDRKIRRSNLLEHLRSHGTLEADIAIPDTAGRLRLVADLRAQQVMCGMKKAAPQDRTQPARVTWLRRQWTDAPEDLRIDAYVANARAVSRSDLLNAIRDDSKVLVEDNKRDIRNFEIVQISDVRMNRSGSGSFVESVLTAITEFYNTVMANVTPWTPPPPQAKTDTTPEAPTPPRPVPTPEDSRSAWWLPS